MFLIKNGLKHGDALLPLILNFSLQYSFISVQANKYGLRLSGKRQLIIYVGDVKTRRVQKETELFKYRANQHRERAAATERT
jgi:hypothetical protein